MYVCEVRFREWTPDGLLRHAAFLRMRHDKDSARLRATGLRATLRRPTPAPRRRAAASERGRSAATAAESDRVEKTIAFSNLKKIYWPADGYTKGDLDRLLPRDLAVDVAVLDQSPARDDALSRRHRRQVVLPEGRAGVRAGVDSHLPDLERGHAARHRYFVCDDVESLLYVANMGSIPMHIWNSRVGSLELPDWCVIDLDPKEAPFSDVIRTAIVLRALCESIGLPSYVKTTGKTGSAHSAAARPAGARTRSAGRSASCWRASCFASSADIATITRHVTKRGDKVYLDYLQNRHGQLIVAPFSVRPLPGASVSMPLVWDEVDQSLDPRKFTIKTAVERMERLGARSGRPGARGQAGPRSRARASRGHDGGVTVRRALPVSARTP